LSRARDQIGSRPPELAGGARSTERYNVSTSSPTLLNQEVWLLGA